MYQGIELSDLQVSSTGILEVHTCEFPSNMIRTVLHAALDKSLVIRCRKTAHSTILFAGEISEGAKAFVIYVAVGQIERKIQGMSFGSIQFFALSHYIYQIIVQTGEHEWSVYKFSDPEDFI